MYRKYLKDDTLLEDEKTARSEAQELWRLPEAERVPPWDWRQGARTSTAAHQAVASASIGTVTCGTKATCSQMTTCGEATTFQRACGLSRLDRDGDGVPCESLCR